MITKGSFYTTQADTMHLYGNQINHVFPTVEEPPSEFDDFRSVKSGELFKLRDIAHCPYPQRWDDGHLEWWEDKIGRRAIRVFYVAKVKGMEPGTFTVVQYSGPEARKAFEEDLRILSRLVTGNVLQIYGVDSVSEMPSLIFWNELVPAAHIKLQHVGILGRKYISSLVVQFGCKSEELWMDPRRGVFCWGPSGPDPGHELRLVPFDIEDKLPSTVELVQDDVVLRFLASLKSKEADHAFFGAITTDSIIGGRDTQVDITQPTVVSTLTQTAIAVANNTLESDVSCLSERKLLEHGLTRFTLGIGSELSLRWNSEQSEAWFSQAWSILHACGISLEDDLSDYQLAYPSASLRGYLSPSQAQRELRSQQPIYLFINTHLPNMRSCKSSSVHYWSFHEDGHLPLSPDACRNFGLPVELEFNCYGSSSWSWSTRNYKHLHQYQRLRGLDPTTTDFARHLGYDQSIFQLLYDSDRFREVFDLQEPSSEHRSGSSTST
ncbi:hypothetical protein PQX77_020281 [Marasmius sp. AFHP31]|nr:hypothetical protein PQX77_020281 [Marasmius sp. AFHP31]